MNNELAFEWQSFSDLSVSRFLKNNCLRFFCCCDELPKALHSLTPESLALAELLVVSLCVVDRTVGAQGRTSKCHCILNQDQREETKGLLHRIIRGLPTGTHLWNVSSPPIVHFGTPLEDIAPSTKKSHFLKCLL